MPRSFPRFLILGLDGGTFDLLDPLMEAGHLPFLRSVAEGGLRAPLISVFPPKTIPAWFSFATGRDPGGLGIFGFTEPDGGPGKSRLVQTFRPSEAIWDHLSRQGIRVGVLNFPLRAGYALNGFVVPGMLSESPVTYPTNLREQLEKRLGEPYAAELPPYRDSARGEWIAQATRAVAQRGHAGEILCEEYRPDFLFALFRETDRVQHQHWAELARSVSQIPPDLVRFWSAVDASCQRIEAAFRSAGGPAVTMVISDHGHGHARADFFTNRWLAQQRFLKFRNGGAQSLRRRALSKLLLASERLGPTRRLVRAGADWLRAGGRREWVGRLVTEESSFEAIAPKIDWERTLAFSYPVPEGIYLNRYNPNLTPAAGEAVKREIRQRLEAYPDAHIEVFDPKEIYRGQNLRNAPALLLRVDGMATELRMDFSYPEPMLRERPGFFYGTGVHRMAGILLARGEGIRPHVADSPFSLLDIAPTVMEGMGLPIPSTMDGRSFASRLGPAVS